MQKDISIKVKNLVVAYDEKAVLWDINLEIPKGSLYAVVGPNGAGKTTLLKAMLNLVKPRAGAVSFTKKVANLSYVPQSTSIDWDFPTTVFDVVLMGAYKKLGWFKRPKKEDKKKALLALSKLGMLEFKDRQIKNLSGGQQQRVFLARALMQDADIYFMDEPFKGVDIVTEKEIVKIMKGLKEEGKTVIVVHHDINTVCEYFDYMALINLKLIADGPVEEVLQSDKLSQAYKTDIRKDEVRYANIASSDF